MDPTLRAPAATPEHLPERTVSLESLVGALKRDLDFGEGIPEGAQRLLRPGMVALWRKAKEPGALMKAEVVLLALRNAAFESSGDAPFTRAELLGFGQECAPLVGRTFGLVAKALRVNLLVLSRTAPTEAERSALRSLRIAPPSITQVEAFHVDTTTGHWWSSAMLPSTDGDAATSMLVAPKETFSFARWLAAVLGGNPPEAAAAAAILPRSSGLADFRAALSDGPATVGILLVLLLVFVAEGWAAGGFDEIDVTALQALGGVSGPAVRAGQVYRLLSATLLHGGIVHLVFNAIGLLLGGALLEVTAGAAWMLLVYVVSGVCGSLLGICLNQPNVVSVGASGAIMGLLAAVFVVTFRMPAGRERTYLQAQVARFLVPSLLPLAAGASGGKVDYSAHVGGALGGALLGLLMVLVWDPAQQRPRFRRGASVLALVGVLLLAGSGIAAVAHAAPNLDEVRLRAADVLVGDRVIPDDFKQAAETVETWGKDRPRDPRVHLYRGLRAFDSGDAVLAERELRLALAEKGILHKFFENGKLEDFTRTTLCELLLKLDRRAEAVREAQPVCLDPKSSSFEAINDLGLCNGTAANSK